MKRLIASAMLCVPFVAAHATTPPPLPVGCTINQYGRVADGSTLWATTTQGIPAAQLPPFETNCLIDQFSYNNFLYLVGDDGSGHPRFMSLVPWYNLLPTKGVPVWPGQYTPLDATELNKAINQSQAGDGFALLDVAEQTTVYDLRVNKVFFDFVKTQKLYQQSVMNAMQTAFNANSYSGGVWFPPTSISDSSMGVIEFKTAWRNFGSGDTHLCPSDIMHCEVDDRQRVWGLVGFHLVQKTNTHGELVWASFEHIANAPDCSAGGSNGIAQFPADPVNTGQTINVNKLYEDGTQNSGWNYFDYGSYKANGGDGKACSFPVKNGMPPTLCLTSPQGDTAGTWKRVDVCRTDILVKPTTPCAALDKEHPNSEDIACLNAGVTAEAPSVWKYYKLIGMEWLSNGNTEGGAFPQGCFTFTDGGFGSSNCPNFGQHGESGSAPDYPRVGSTTMANTTMETWMQAGTWLNEDTNATDCFGCHQPQTIAQPATSTSPAFNQADMSHILDRIAQ